MTRTLLLLTSLLLVGKMNHAQGINFETGDWESVIAKANQAGKLVYVDVYTTWCAPCKMLEKSIYPKKEAGDKFNPLFICYRLDAEKGDGIDLAKQYNVTSYPTHLFINPKSRELVYKQNGASDDVKVLLSYADMAIEESKDSMTWDKMTQLYPSRKKDKTFLKAYLQKAGRLKMNNDALLNSYARILDKKKIPDDDLILIAEQMQTIDNEMMPVMAANRARIDKHYDLMVKDYYEQLISRWIYGTLKKAIKDKNESLLPVIEKGLKTYLLQTDETEMNRLRTTFYEQYGDPVKLLAARGTEADYIVKKPLKVFDQEDIREIETIKSSFRWQLKSAGVTDDKMEAVVDANLRNDSTLFHAVSTRTGIKLNSLAWEIYEKHGTDKPMVEKALVWSVKSMELSSNTATNWISFADTYAHLLYKSGRQEEAVKMQHDAISKAKSIQLKDISNYEAELAKMRNGTL